MTQWRKRWGRGSQTRPMDCHEVGQLLQHYLDDELDQRRAARIAAHLDDCRRCGLEAEAYERIKASLTGRRPDVPLDALERLREFGRHLAQGEEPSNT